MRIIMLSLALAVGCSGDDVDPEETGEVTETGEDTETDEDTETGGDDEADLVNGELMHEGCNNAYCHGGNTILNDRVPQMTDDDLYSQIRKGGGYMPAQDGMTDADITDVIAFLRVTYTD